MEVFDTKRNFNCFYKEDREPQLAYIPYASWKLWQDLFITHRIRCIKIKLWQQSVSFIFLLFPLYPVFIIFIIWLHVDYRELHNTGIELWHLKRLKANLTVKIAVNWTNKKVTCKLIFTHHEYLTKIKWRTVIFVRPKFLFVVLHGPCSQFENHVNLASITPLFLVLTHVISSGW